MEGFSNVWSRLSQSTQEEKGFPCEAGQQIEDSKRCMIVGRFLVLFLGKKNKETHFFPPFVCISWRLITLQYCSGFCHTLT